MFMRVSFLSKVVCAVALLVLFFEANLFAHAQSVVATPEVPETSVAQDNSAEPVQAPQIPDPRELLHQLTRSDDFPAALQIPSIHLNVPVINVGVNAKGEMDVPDGRTNNVGWYGRGTIPGEMGSAVFDAHVFAAFKNLRYVKIGDNIYVTTKSGEVRHFVVRSSMIYKTEQVPVNLLFNVADDQHLNLITCAGKYVASRGTYDHRLIVYAVLMDK
jgi:LPXTG-site transpeptidase (sortase) family protein